MATLTDLRELQAAGAASAVAPAEVDRVWRGFAGGIYNKAQAMQALGAAPQPAASVSRSSVSKPAAPSTPAAHVGPGRASGGAAASAEEKLAAEIVSSYLGNAIMASDTADAVAADVVKSYLAMKDPEP